MVFKSNSGCDVEKTVGNSSFKITANAKLFSILSDGVYVRKIDAVIREICSNAYDAHIEARQEKPFLVKLPSPLDLEFKVRDYGFGLSPEDMSMYTTYGESTKSVSNAYIGAFGIGAKSPFAYTNTFNVVSYQNGKGRAYSMFIEGGAPQMTLMGEFDTEEEAGLEVFFSVKQDDVEEFRQKAIPILSFMADKVKVVNGDEIWAKAFEDTVAGYKWVDASYIEDGYQTCNVTVDYVHESAYILQGNVAYELNVKEVKEILGLALKKDGKVPQRDDFSLAGIIRVPNGTFIPHPSRERLTLDEATKGKLKLIFYKIFKHLIFDRIDTILSSAKTYYELYLLLQDESGFLCSFPQIDAFSIESQNTKAGDSVEQKICCYADWKKRNFYSLDIRLWDNGSYAFKKLVRPMYVFSKPRVYFTEKYPFSHKDRLRLIADICRNKMALAIVLTPDSMYGMFTESDKDRMINVQSLPPLTDTEKERFQNNNVTISGNSKPRARKEQLSYFSISEGQESIETIQKTVAEIADAAVNMPIMWVGSDKRYEFPFGESKSIKLKVVYSCGFFLSNVQFYTDHLKKKNPDTDGQFGIVVLPEGHTLRTALPEFMPVLREALLFEANAFLQKNYFDVDIRNDPFINALQQKPELFDRLLRNFPHRKSFEKWRASGYQDNSRKERNVSFPFFLFEDQDVEKVKKEYESKDNITKISIYDFYQYLREEYPLLQLGYGYWNYLNSSKVVRDLIEYLEFKLGMDSLSEKSDRIN